MKPLLPLLSLFALLFTSCGQPSATPKPTSEGDPKKSAPASGEGPTFAAVFDAKGKLVDWVHITPEAHIQRIEFIAPESGEKIQATMAGPGISDVILQAFRPGMLVTTSAEEGMMGLVTVEVEDGIIQSIYGNGFGMSPSPLLTPEMLAEMKAAVDSGEERTHPDSTVIVYRDRYARDLVEDADGNLIPPEMTGQEQDFLEQFRQALKSNDDAKLAALIAPWTGPDRKLERYAGVKDEIKSIRHSANMGEFHFEFRKFDPEHPDMQEHFTSHGPGTVLKNSLEPGWLLTLYSVDKNSSNWSSPMLVGEDANGQLKITLGIFVEQPDEADGN